VKLRLVEENPAARSSVALAERGQLGTEWGAHRERDVFEPHLRRVTRVPA
jgi:hypothetical protein